MKISGWRKLVKFDIAGEVGCLWKETAAQYVRRLFAAGLLSSESYSKFINNLSAHFFSAWTVIRIWTGVLRASTSMTSANSAHSRQRRAADPSRPVSGLRWFIAILFRRKRVFCEFLGTPAANAFSKAGVPNLFQCTACPYTPIA